MIKDKPIIGNGIFSYYDKFPVNNYAHNLILEVLVQGGIIYLIVFASFLTFLGGKSNKIRKQNKRLFNIVFILVVYQFGELMVSGTYVKTGLFWLIISYITFYKTNQIKLINKQKNKKEYL